MESFNTTIMREPDVSTQNVVSVYVYVYSVSEVEGWRRGDRQTDRQKQTDLNCVHTIICSVYKVDYTAELIIGYTLSYWQEPVCI